MPFRTLLYLRRRVVFKFGEVKLVVRGVHIPVEGLAGVGKVVQRILDGEYLGVEAVIGVGFAVYFTDRSGVALVHRAGIVRFADLKRLDGFGRAVVVLEVDIQPVFFIDREHAGVGQPEIRVLGEDIIHVQRNLTADDVVGADNVTVGRVLIAEVQPCGLHDCDAFHIDRFTLCQLELLTGYVIIKFQRNQLFVAMVAAGPDPSARRRACTVNVLPVGRAAGERYAVVDPVGNVPRAPCFLGKSRLKGFSQLIGAGHSEHCVGDHFQFHRITLDFIDSGLLRRDSRAFLRLGGCFLLG